MTTQTTTAEKQDGRKRDNPAHAVLKHLAIGNADLVKTAIREVTIERLESSGAVAGLADLRAELFGGGANGSGDTAGAASRAARGEDRKPRQMTLGEAARAGKPKGEEDEDVEEEEVEDDIDEEETPAPDAPLRRPVARKAGKGKTR